MEDVVGVELRRIVLRYGPAIGEDARRVEALLRDLSGAHRREIAVLSGAAREGIPAELTSSRGAVPEAVLEERLARVLQDNLGLSEDAARWAVTTWAAALAGAPAATAPAAAGPSVGQPPSASVSSLPSLPPSIPLAGPSEAEVTDRLLALPFDESGDLAWSVLGLLAVADGPLTMSDAAGIVRQPVRQVHRAIAPVSELIVRDGLLAARGEPFRRAVAGYLGQAELAAQRAAVVHWCLEQAGSVQPGRSTSEYVLRHGREYFAEAGRDGELSRLVNGEWMRQSAARTGSFSVFTRDMLAAAQAAAAKNPPGRPEELRASLAGVTAASIAATLAPEALGVLASAGQAERALDLAGLVAAYSRPDAYYRIAAALHAGGDAKAADAAAAKAIAAAVSIDRGSGTDYALGSLLNSMHESGMTRWAVQAASALPADSRIGGLDEWYGSIAVEVWAKVGDADAAWRAARRLSGASYYKDTAFRTAATALARAGRPEDAIEAAGEVGSGAAGGLLGEIAAVTAERGDIPATIAVIRAAPDGNERLPAVAQAGGALARARRVDGIAEIMGTLAAEEDRRLATYQVAKVLAGAGEAARAVSMWRAVATEEDKEYFIADLAKIAADAGDIDSALRIADGLGEAYSRRKAQIQVAGAAARAGDLPRAAELVPGEEYEKNSALAEVVRDLAGQDRFDDAIALADLITRPDKKAESLTEVAAALTTAGNHSRSAALAEAVADVTANPAGAAHARALLTWATALARAGQREQAAGTAERAVAAARKGSDQGVLAEALATWSATLNLSGHADAAVTAAGQAVALLSEDVLAGSKWAKSVAAILAEAGPPAEAVAAASAAGGEYPDPLDKTLSGVAEALARRGLAAHAIEVARTAGSLLVFQAEETLKEIARILARHGHGDGARQAIAAMAEVQGNADYADYAEYERARLFREVAKLLAENGAVDAALSAARATEPSQDRPAALTEVACAVAVAGDIRRGVEIAEEVSPQALAKVADALSAAGRPGDALQLAEDAVRRVLAARPAFPDTVSALASLLRLATASRPGDQGSARQEPAGPLSAVRQAIRDYLAVSGTAEGAPAQAAAAAVLAGTADPVLRGLVVTAASQALLSARALPDPNERAAVLGDAASALAQYGESEMAAKAAGECLALVAANARDFVGQSAPGLALGVLADTGRSPEALAGIGSLGSDAEKARALADVAGRMVKNEQAGILLQFLRDIGLTELIPETGQRISALANVGVVLARAGETAAASQLAEEIARSGEAAEEYLKALTLAEQALLLSALGRRTEAVEQARLALAMPMGAVGFWWGNVVTKAVEALVECAHLEEAMAAVQTLPAGSFPAPVATIAAALFGSGAVGRAVELVSAELAAVRAVGARDGFYTLVCEHLPRHPGLFRAWLGEETEIAQIGAELAAIEQWWT
jgi:hypothetical protein